MLADYVSNKQQTSFVYPSAVDNFKRQFAHLEGGGVPGRMPGHNGNLGQVCTCLGAHYRVFHDQLRPVDVMIGWLCVTHLQVMSRSASQLEQKTQP